MVNLNFMLQFFTLLVMNSLFYFVFSQIRLFTTSEHKDIDDLDFTHTHTHKNKAIACEILGVAL